MIRTHITDTELLNHLSTLEDDCREVFLLHDGSIRAVVVQGTHTINQMRANHGLGILETLVLGHAYLAGGILSSTVKGDDRVQLNIECGGPIGGISIESWAIGAVRGYLKEVPIPIEKPLESFDLSPFFGPGFLTVTKLLEGKKQPFTGQIMLHHGSIAKDLAHYFLTSEQTPSVVSLSIQFNRKGDAIGAGGLFLQQLPGGNTGNIEDLERICANLPSLGKYLSEGKSGFSYVEEVFAQSDPRHLQRLPYGFSCPCDRKRFADYLSSLPKEEKQEIVTSGPFPLELHCFNCGTIYSFEKDELDVLLQ